MSVEALAAAVARRYPDALVARDEVAVVVDRDELLAALAWLRDEPALRFDFLSCVTATHWPGRSPAFWVVYELRSIPRRERLRVKVGLAEDDAVSRRSPGCFPRPTGSSARRTTSTASSSTGIPHLRRILLPADWEGFPLRKDEPLGGVPTWFRGVRVPPIDERGMA